MSSGVILLQRPYSSFSFPLLLILRWEITAAAVALFPSRKDIPQDTRPATLSSWLKQIILLCCKQADQQSLDFVQGNVHDIRAFVTSKALYSGISVDQIMQACHWKPHNTFTNFYVKDLTWSGNGNSMYLGLVVVQQV